MLWFACFFTWKAAWGTLKVRASVAPTAVQTAPPGARSWNGGFRTCIDPFICESLFQTYFPLDSLGWAPRERVARSAHALAGSGPRGGGPRGLREPLRTRWRTPHAQAQGALRGYLHLQLVTGCVSPSWLPSRSTTDVAAWKTNSAPPSSGGRESKIKGSAGLESLPAAEGRLLPVSARDLASVGAPDTSSSHGDPRQIGLVPSLMASST